MPGPVAKFGELVHWMPLVVEGRPPPLEARYMEGYYAGEDEETNTHIILTDKGPVRCRSIKRRPISERWGGGILDDCNYHVLQPNPLLPGVRFSGEVV